MAGESLIFTYFWAPEILFIKLSLTFFVFGWQPSACFDDDKFEEFVPIWRDAGAKLIGGCCRTTPATIRSISKVLKERPQLSTVLISSVQEMKAAD